jgi:hypothetical protein
MFGKHYSSSNWNFITFVCPVSQACRCVSVNVLIRIRLCVLRMSEWSGKAGQKIFEHVPCRIRTNPGFDYAATPARPGTGGNSSLGGPGGYTEFRMLRRACGTSLSCRRVL